MKALLYLSARSAWSRRSTLILVVISVALSTLLLLSFEQTRHDLRQHFSKSVSGTDLIVGPRTGAVQLLLYSVFRLGDATQNMQYRSLKTLSQHPQVAWVIPLSLGDSHRGFPVLATDTVYFQHFLYGERQALRLAQGRAFQAGLPGLYEAVVGAQVASALGYTLNQKIVLNHGSGEMLGSEHDDKPFTVVGVLAPTGTPVDRTVHINLHGMEAIHLDWMGGAPLPGVNIGADEVRKFNLEARQITVALVGLKNRSAVFAVQREVADFRAEPLMAVLPGVALDQLWQIIGVGEQALWGLSLLLGLVSTLGLVAVILAGLNQRRRELAVLRAVGAAPRHIFLLLVLEGLALTVLGILLGWLVFSLAVMGLAPWLESSWGLALHLNFSMTSQWVITAGVALVGTLASLIPGWRAYRLSLVDGLAPPV